MLQDSLALINTRVIVFLVKLAHGEVIATGHHRVNAQFRFSQILIQPDRVDCCEVFRTRLLIVFVFEQSVRLGLELFGLI